MTKMRMTEHNKENKVGKDYKQYINTNKSRFNDQSMWAWGKLNEIIICRWRTKPYLIIRLGPGCSKRSVLPSFSCRRFHA